MKRAVVIAGVSGHYHDAAACVLVDGALVAAAAEERFSRRKHDRRLPVRALGACLREVGLTLADVDAIAWYEDPAAKLGRQLWSLARRPAAERLALDPGAPLREIREQLGFDGPVLTPSHHRAHAASAFFFSGFERAAILTIDAVGEWDTTTWAEGRGGEIEVLAAARFPDSLGLFYSTLTAYLGFEVNEGEYKVMGLAPLGEPTFAGALRDLFRVPPGDDGFALEPRFFDYVDGPVMWSPALTAHLGLPPRRPGAPIEQAHRDLARSAQLVFEEAVLAAARRLRRLTDAPDLCLAGGGALNCVANARIRREAGFRDVFVLPAPGDDGAAIGAAALAHVELTGRPPPRRRLETTALGPSFPARGIERLLDAARIPWTRYDPAALARRLADGAVAGWLEGRMELGPRALGHRSILASPLLPDMRARVNARIKRREGFRPFAPCVLLARAPSILDTNLPLPFMTETCQVRRRDLPAVTHADGSARPQTVDPAREPRLAALLLAFEAETGIAVLLNTSLNLRGEPIACTPEDALLCLARSELDLLVLEDAVVERRDLPEGIGAWAEAWPRPEPRPPSPLYTFV